MARTTSKTKSAKEKPSAKEVEAEVPSAKAAEAEDAPAKAEVPSAKAAEAEDAPAKAEGAPKNAEVNIPAYVDDLMRLYPQYEELYVTADGFVHPKGASAALRKDAQLYKNKYYKS